MKNLFDSVKNICKASTKDQSLMLILTSAAGWILSSAAQVMAVACNDKIPQNEKNFLIPQEIYDGLTNVATFLGITLFIKNQFAKLIKNNKIVLKNPKQYTSPFLTVISIASGAIASNIITPFVRNHLGANAQKRITDKEFKEAEKMPNSLKNKFSKTYFRESPFEKWNKDIADNNFTYYIVNNSSIKI